MQNVFREVRSRIIFENRSFLDFPAHIHEDIELVFTKKGGGNAFCDGKKYLLSANSVFLVFPNQVHHYSECVNGEYVVLIIKPIDLLGYGNIFEEYTPASSLYEFAGGDDRGVFHLMKSALSEFESDGYSMIISAYLTALFGKLFKCFEINKSKATSDTVSRILSYCASHYKENITIEQVAKSLHLSRSSVSHIFGKRLNINFCDYINSLRLSDAVNLLQNGNYSVTEISFMSGFPTVRTFNRAFQKRYGISPSKFKKS